MSSSYEDPDSQGTEDSSPLGVPRIVFPTLQTTTNTEPTRTPQIRPNSTGFYSVELNSQLTDVDIASTPLAHHPASTSTQYQPTPLRVFFNDDEQVPPNKRLSFCMVLASHIINNFNVEELEPYSHFIEKTPQGKLKAPFDFPPKKVIENEAKRRNPGVKLNMSNRSASKLIDFLSKIPMNDEDKAFVVEKEKMYREIYQHKFDDAEKAKRSAPITDKDRLQFICLFD